MNKLAIAACLALVVYGRCGAAPPATRPAPATTQASQAVRVEGLDFQIVTQAIWHVPTDAQGTSVHLALKVTNHTGKAAQLNVFDTIELHLKDAAGKELAIGGGRDATAIPLPVLIKDGQSAIIDRGASLKPMDGQPGTLRLVGSDGAGGNWQIDALKPGRYSIGMTCQSTQEAVARIQALPAKHVVDSVAAPFWIGKAATSELGIEIAVKPAAAAQRPPADGKALTKAEIAAKCREFLTDYSARELKDTPAMQFSKEDIARGPGLVARDGENWRMVFTNARGNKAVIWMDPKGTFVKVQVSMWVH